MLTIVSFLVVIGVLIFVHELGHLLAAKAVDIEAPVFSIGFGPRIAGFKWGETEYVISALPLGGYVKMAGMEDTSALEGGADVEHVPSPRDFDAKPVWARAIVISAGVIMNFLFAAVVLTGIAFFIGEPVNPSTRVAVDGELDPAVASLANVPVGAEITAINGDAVASWNEVLAIIDTVSAGQTRISFAGVPDAVVDLPADPIERQQTLRPLQEYYEPVVGEVTPNSAAATAGIQAGDRIVEADGEPIRTWSDFVAVVRERPEQAISLVVDRNGERVPLTTTPDAETELNAEMERIQVGRLGVRVQADVEYRPLSAGDAIQYGVGTTYRTSAMIVGLVGDLLTGQESPRALGGPLAISQLSAQAARYGMEEFLRWMALLSVNLAVLNLLPIPVLDGGQLLFIAVEAVRGRPLSIEQRLRLSHVGLIIVVGIMVWAITNDFLRFFGI